MAHYLKKAPGIPPESVTGKHHKHLIPRCFSFGLHIPVKDIGKVVYPVLWYDLALSSTIYRDLLLKLSFVFTVKEQSKLSSFLPWRKLCAGSLQCVSQSYWLLAFAPTHCSLLRGAPHWPRTMVHSFYPAARLCTRSFLLNFQTLLQCTESFNCESL